MYDELADVLDRSAPSVARDAAIEAEVVRLTRSVVATGATARRSRRARLVLGGAAFTLALGTGAVAAGSLVSDIWDAPSDVKSSRNRTASPVRSSP